MIKIGRSFFNENQIAAIQPSAAGDVADVYLVRGAVISESVGEDDIQEVLKAAGLFSSGPAVEILTFAPAEHQELWLAYEDGYLFAAKDLSGQVYAYSRCPDKARHTWHDQGGGKAPRRLHGDFDCLAFDDDEPLDLCALFSGDPAEGPDDV